MLAMHPELNPNTNPNQTSPSRALKRDASSQSPLDTLAAAAVTTNPPPGSAKSAGPSQNLLGQKNLHHNAHTADHQLSQHQPEPSAADQLKDRQLAAAVAAAEQDAQSAFAVKSDPGARSSQILSHHQTGSASLWQTAPNPANTAPNGSDDAAIDTEIKALSDPNAKHQHYAYPSENYQQAVSAAAAAAADYSYGSPHGSPPNAMSLERLNNPVVGGGAAPNYGLLDSESPNSSAKTPRKKKQCDVCGRFYSNLATHKSIHLSDNSRPHTCGMCGRGFARPNDLFRHQKSHRGDAPFRCPLFYKPPSLPLIDGSSAGLYDPPCHQNGGFSRCDTYKNHLKAMHFEYPAGTKKRDRAGMEGKCRACKLHFGNADDWISNHIETAECEGVKKVQAKMNGLV